MRTTVQKARKANSKQQTARKQNTHSQTQCVHTVTKIFAHTDKKIYIYNRNGSIGFLSFNGML